MIEIAVANRLKATIAVTALASTRIYQLILPQAPTTPAVRVQLIDEPQTYHLRGGHVEKRARVQVDAYVAASVSGDPYGKAVDLADAIEGALTGAPWTQGVVSVRGSFRDSRETLYEAGELRLVRVRQDFILWWRED